MTKSVPIIFSLSMEKIIQKINEFQVIGYKRDDVIRITKSMPQLFGYGNISINKKIEDIQNIGYSKDEVIAMIKKAPQLYGYSIESIYQKIRDIQSLGYSKEEAIKMTKNLPQLYGLSIENIKQKVDFYESIDMRYIVTEKTSLLMQSTKLSYARYMFFKDNNIVFEQDNSRKLFCNQKEFEKRYGITNEQLLEKYPYNAEKIVDNEEEEKQELINKILEQQKTIFKQEEEINELKNQREL